MISLLNPQCLRYFKFNPKESLGLIDAPTNIMSLPPTPWKMHEDLSNSFSTNRCSCHAIERNLTWATICSASGISCNLLHLLNRWGQHLPQLRLRTLPVDVQKSELPNKISLPAPKPKGFKFQEPRVVGILSTAGIDQDKIDQWIVGCPPKKSLKECQLIGILHSPTAFIFTWHQSHGRSLTRRAPQDVWTKNYSKWAKFWTPNWMFKSKSCAKYLRKN